MIKRLRPVPPVVLGWLLGTILACDLQEPDRYIRAPVIKSFSPRASTFTVAVGESLFFSVAAVDPYDSDLEYRFEMADSVASKSANWTYVVEDTGVIDVKGCVSNGVSESVIRWRVARVTPVNLPPEIVEVDPPEPEITVVVGAAVDFAVNAIDPEGKPLSYAYAIGDSIVGVTRRYTYQSTLVGMFDVRALVTDGESFVSHAWTLRVAAEPDSISPAQVVIVSIGPGHETGEVDVEWIAVGDDSMAGLPSYYVVRTSPVPIPDEHAWNSSSNRDGEPPPAPSGGVMRMTVRDLPPAQTVFIAVRAMDDFGLISPLSPLASTRARGVRISGTVSDGVSGSPVEGVRVKLLSVADTTDADGAFLLADLPAGVGFITLEDEFFRTEVGEYFDVVISPYTIRDKDVVDVSLLPNIPLESDMYPDFLQFFNQMAWLEGYSGDRLSRWDTPCKVHVPAYEEGDLDYRQSVQDAFRDWENVIGLEVFEFVESVPDTGIFVTFGGRDSYIVTRRGSDGLPIQGCIILGTGYTATPDSLLSVVARHEVGHALGLNHSTDSRHIMFVSPGVKHPSPDEVKLVRAMYRLPRGFPAAWFRAD